MPGSANHPLVVPVKSTSAHNLKMSDDDEKQVSEVSAMTPDHGMGNAPGTDDGVPPAQDAQSQADGPPRDYRADKTVSPATSPERDPKELG